MVMDQKVEYYKLPFYRRLTSIFMDLMMLILLFTIFLFPISSIIDNKIEKNQELTQCIKEMNDILVESGLFIVDKSGTITEDISDKAISLGYEYLNKLETYLSIKNESELFEYENGTYVEIGTKEEMNEFYKENWKIVYQELVSTEEYNKYNQKYIEIMEKYSGITYAISIVASIVILFMIIPIFSNNGKTLGKLIFKVSIVTNYYQKPNKLQVFIRQFFFVLLTFTFIPTIISLILVLFDKQGKSLHDYISSTRLIDSNIEKMLIKNYDENKEINNQNEEKKLIFKEGK